MKPADSRMRAAAPGLRDITNLVAQGSANTAGLAASKAVKRPAPAPAAQMQPKSSVLAPSVPKVTEPQRALAQRPLPRAASTSRLELAGPAHRTENPAPKRAPSAGPPARQRPCRVADVDPAPEVAEYITDIHHRLFAAERLVNRPLPNYMSMQTDINSKMRGILVDWLIEVHAKMKQKLRRESLFLCVNLTDRFLAKVQVSRRRLQLVGVVAMLVAAKFEEVDVPHVAELIYMCDNAYTVNDILGAEVMMLNVLGFRVVEPTAALFMERLLAAVEASSQQRSLAFYLLELTLTELQMIRHLPSLIAASAVWLSSVLLQRSPAWSEALTELARYDEADMQECGEELYGLLEAAPGSTLPAVHRKYSHERFHSVSRMEHRGLLATRNDWEMPLASS